MNKFLRIVSAVARITWSLSGILIFILLFVAVAFLAISYFDNTDFDSEPEVIVGKELEEARAKGLILQGLAYDQPLRILYTDYLLLPVSLKTYENPRHTRDKFEEMKSLKMAYETTAEYDNMVNVVFLNKQLEVQTTLLDRKGFISSFRFPGADAAFGYRVEPDSLQRHITYLIAFEDSNEDGIMNEDDNRDLYISDLNGGNLKKITTNVDITHYYFMDRNQVVIKYQRREKEAKEHRKEYFAVYSIKEGSLKELSSLHDALNKIESIIVK